MIKYRGETFSGYNKAKRTPTASKSHAVLAKVGVADKELVTTVAVGAEEPVWLK